MEVTGYKNDSSLSSQILGVEALSGEYLGADAHHKTKMMTPLEPGIWKLHVQIDGEDFVDVVVISPKSIRAVGSSFIL